MRYPEIAQRPDRTPTQEDRLRTATLHVLDGEWAELKQVRQAHGPTRITAVRSLAPRFKGFSVDVLCRNEEVATDLLVAWCNPSAYQQGSRKAAAPATGSAKKP